ncbi:hypothetical protein MLD38_004507 [Melastoma candidum]|uniref:Uncharacterized protein n=1 Tax=Melastoma candidum TaxID=119954 RepID=A0ACB9S969_9MYRT|nr:hypothetical protein MLD38_004507 [Melastoma candidum]
MARFQALILIHAVFVVPCCWMSRTANAATFTITNGCGFPVWPGLLSGAGTPQLPTTGFLLQPGESSGVAVPSSWSGRIWGRTSCFQDPVTGKFSCRTGDCGSSTLECSGSGAAPPTSLAEFTLNGADGLDFYDVSLVDGYNLPLMIEPRTLQGTIEGGSGTCLATGCATDLNVGCPAELKVADDVACKSACGAFGDEQHCCSGAYGSPDTCSPTAFSQYFKNGCPKAYSYAYDDKSSTFTCGGSPDYVVTFCPSAPASVKAAALAQVPGNVTGGAGTSAAACGHAKALTGVITSWALGGLLMMCIL